jgi:pyridoxal/pyridoxine/pyridoxamine kinase
MAEVTKLAYAPHGTGDLFTGALTAAFLRGAPNTAALAIATGAVRTALHLSHGPDDLALARMDWANGILPVAVQAWP